MIEIIADSFSRCDGGTSGAAVLDDEEASFAVLLEHGGVS